MKWQRLPTAWSFTPGVSHWREHTLSSPQAEWKGSSHPRMHYQDAKDPFTCRECVTRSHGGFHPLTDPIFPTARHGPRCSCPSKRAGCRAPVSPGSPGTTPAPHLRGEIRWKGPRSMHGNQVATASWRVSHLAGLVCPTKEHLPIHTDTSEEKFYLYWQVLTYQVGFTPIETEGSQQLRS